MGKVCQERDPILSASSATMQHDYLLSLKHLLQSNSTDVQYNATNGLANLCRNTRNHMRLAQHRFLPELFTLVKHTDIGVKTAACRALSNLVVTPLLHREMVVLDCFSAMVAPILEASDQCRC